ncbi:EscU/YscU/HrcU family type III secretion system export apparatus switch protein [Emcibacter nanhaiensis]|uniref:Flagellar protein FhlB n=1 Tax=Emcibacter nanhaiensis TaxID=1505037 RepID=A0A501PT07_9PROT|nr:EscU/YscU/HrcU family type III secretion system export apparatus switch protein [Emcibacter nanhaiensis]TPD62851.1 flagellar protein FhlB [Emcibacter nanhaiensis]
MTMEQSPDQTRQTAVALSQEGERGNVPRITATGKGENAEKILQIAFASGVKVRQDEDLVTLLDLFDEGDLIPVEALQTVTEILSYLYQEQVNLDMASYDRHRPDVDQAGNRKDHR